MLIYSDKYPSADWIRHFCCDVRAKAGASCAATPNLQVALPMDLCAVMRGVGFAQLGEYPVSPTPSTLAEIVVILGINDMTDRHYQSFRFWTDVGQGSDKKNMRDHFWYFLISNAALLPNEITLS